MTEAPDRSDQFYRRIFSNIVRGYSKTSYKKNDVYIKHFSFEEQGHLEESYHEAYEKARKEGLESEEECYTFLQEEGLWTKEEEQALQAQEGYVSNLEQTRKQIAIPSQAELISQDLEVARKKLEEIQQQKIDLLPETCESYAQKKSNDLVVYYSYYVSPECNKKLFSWDEYCSLSKNELHSLFVVYNDAVAELSIENIKHLALSNFFSLYGVVLGSKEMHTFFDKSMPEHTFYQLHLLNYAKILTSILENVENIPEQFKTDPDKLMDFASAGRKGEKMRERSSEADGYSVVGASSKDMKDIGIKDIGTQSIHELAKQKGGTLSLEDFAKMK